MKRGKVVVFPFAYRRGLILRLAEQMAVRGPAAAEKYLQQQLQRQISTLRRAQRLAFPASFGSWAAKNANAGAQRARLR